MCSLAKMLIRQASEYIFLYTSFFHSFCKLIIEIFRAEKCFGYVYHDSSKNGRRKAMCAECAKEKKRIQNKLKKRIKKQIELLIEKKKN